MVRTKWNQRGQLGAVCFYLRNEFGKYLAVSRKDNHNDFGSPGGKVDNGETPEQAVVREVLEETGVVVDPVSLELLYDALCFGRTDFNTGYYTGRVTGELSTKEAGVVAWVTYTQLTYGSFGNTTSKFLDHIGEPDNVCRFCHHVYDCHDEKWGCKVAKCCCNPSYGTL